MLPVNELATIASAVVGAAALVLSAVKFLDGRKEKKFRVHVTLNHGWPFYENHGLGRDSLLIEAANPGSLPVTLTSCGILLPNGKTLVSPFGNGNNLPFEMVLGKNCVKWLDTLGVTEALLREGWQGKIKLVGFYGDALGRKHKSKPLKFDVGMWQKIAVEEKR